MSDRGQDQTNRPGPTSAVDHLDDTLTAGQEAIDTEPNILATSNASGVTTRNHHQAPPPLLSESHVMPQPMPAVQTLTQTEPRVMPQPMPAIQAQAIITRLAATEQQNLELQRQLAQTLQALDSMRNNQSAQSPAGSATHSAFTAQLPIGGPLPPSPATSVYCAQAFPTNVKSAPDGNQTVFADQSANYSAQMHVLHSNIANVGTNSAQIQQMHPVMPILTPSVMQPNGDSAQNAQVHMNNFSTRPTHDDKFAMLVQRYANVPRWRIQQDAWLDLLPQLMDITGDNRERSDELLHMILDESDVLEILRLRCFPNALPIRMMGIQEREMKARFAQNSVMGISSIPRGGGSAFAQSDSTSTSGPARSDASSGIYATSASAAPSQKVESIIKDLLSGRWEQAAAALNGIQEGSGNMLPPLPLAPEKKEEAIPDNLSSTLSALEQATRLLARNPARSNDDYSNAEKVKFTSYKNAGTGQNQTSIDHIIWQWETEFDSAGIPPKVSRVLGLMQPGGNLSDWKDTFRSISRDINDPDDIRNWSWARFCQEMYASTMYTPPDKKKLLDAFLNVKCQDPGTPEQITAYTTQFSMALQNLKLNRLHDSFSPAQQAQTYYNNLTKLVKYHMALRDPKREDPEIRTDLTELRAEVHNVVKWTVFKDAASQAASGGRAVGALGLNAGPRNVAPTKRLEPQKGEIVKFSKATPQSEHWLSSNAARFKCRHALVSGGSRHVLVGNPINLNALFANSEACSAGIIDMPRRPPRPNDSTRSTDANKPNDTVNNAPNVSAQSVQADLPLSSVEPVSESPAEASAAYEFPQSVPDATTPNPKPAVYSYSTGTIHGWTPYGGRARGLAAVCPRTDPSNTRASASIFNKSNATPVNLYEQKVKLTSDQSDQHTSPYVSLDTADLHVEAIAQKVRVCDHAARVSFATRAARCGKAGLAALKYIATYDLTGVLRPIAQSAQRFYVPKRQVQKVLMFVLAVYLMCVTVGIISCIRAHAVTISVVPVTLPLPPFILSGSVGIRYATQFMSAQYHSSVQTIQQMLFPDSRPRYSNFHPNVDTSDPYTRARPHTNAMFQNLSMTGSGKDLDTQAALVCLHLNFESKHSKIGMLDSGCNNPMQALTDDVRESVMDFDPHGRITGDQVSGEFTTDASGTLGITLNGVSPTGATFAFDFIVEKMQLVRDLSYNLFPASFFTRRGCDVFFHGRKHLHDNNQAGTGEIRLHEITPHSRRHLGNVHLRSWNDLWFFNYNIFNPAQDIAMAASASHMTKLSATIKAHVTYGHASGRRVYGAFKQSGRGDDILSDLPCPCPICAVTKSDTPGHRKFERYFQHDVIDDSKITGDYLIAHDPRMQEAIAILRDMDIQAQSLSEHEGAQSMKIGPSPRKGIVAAQRRSTAPRQYWHADTIPLRPNWQKAKHALILVDDFTRQTFVKLLKNKTQFDVAEALDQHFNQQRPLTTGVKGVNFYVRNTVLRSDRGSEFINTTVLDLCARHGCVPEYSCPGQLGKYQNGVVERRVKEIRRMARAMMHTAHPPDLANAYCILHAVDILNMLPTTANPADPASNLTGFSSHLLYYNSAPPLEQIYAFGSFCTVHLDEDHIQHELPNVRAASCVYLCRAHHYQSQGHMVWQYDASGKGRKLIVPELSRHIWNYFPMRPSPDQHLSNSLTFVAADLDMSHSTSHASGTPISHTDAATDPICSQTPDSHVLLETEEALQSAPSAHKTRQFARMSKNIGAKVRRVFFINGTSGPVDFFEGTVRSITPSNKYDIVYDDNDSEEMSEREYAYYSQPPKLQSQAHVARLGGDQWWKQLPSCNCAERHCYHPWAKNTLHFTPSEAGTNVAKSGIRKSDTSDGKRYRPSRIPPIIPEYYAASHFPEIMPDVVDINNPIQGMLSHAAMMSARKKSQKLSAYDPDPITVEDCVKSKNWETPEAGNSWKHAILNEIGNLMKFKVFDVIAWEDVPTSERVWQIVVNFLTKRTKDSTPEQECIDKRKCRICFGGHHMTAGVHFERTEAYAPVPSWTTIKLQLALTAKHRLGLKAFDCTAAYLQAELKKPLYARPPRGLMGILQKEMGGELGTNASDVWKLRKALYGYAGSSRLWWDKVSSWLENYGFRSLGNSGTFMMLDRRDSSDPSMRGIILLNLYSDDGLASIDNSVLWDKFMTDFKHAFDVVEKDPDYFLGCAIEWDPETGIIQLDASKYLREVIAKFDLLNAHPSPIPSPAGMKIYANANWDGDEGFRNLYQQYCGCINYASLIRPELSFYASQICRVMSSPNEDNLRAAQNILRYALGSLDEKITYRPALADDPLGDYNYGLMAFTDSDWATSVDTRRSHGCYIIMLAGGCIAHRSKAHKSVMLSSAAAEYYEASEGCRELIYIRGILEDFYGESLPATPMYIDNAACIAMGTMPVFSERQKHIPIRVCHLKECCKEGIVELRHIGTKYQLADIGTKALPAPVFLPLRDVILGKVSFSDLQGL